MVEYRYDAWGKLLATTGSMAATLGKLNPLRYRGYIYDEETGLYWLRSRYYNPEWKRFVNADSVMGVVGSPITHNMYTYCNNSPVNRLDSLGTNSILVTMITRIKNSFAIATHSVVTSRNPNPKAEIVTVSSFIANLEKMAVNTTDVSSSKDTGCAMYIRAAIVGILKRHGHHVYAAGMTSMFKNNMILKGSISDIGGPNGLLPGMIVGTVNNEGKVTHGGVYYGLHDFGNGLEPAVYSFNTKKKHGNLRPFTNQNWMYYGWHEGVIWDEP